MAFRTRLFLFSALVVMVVLAAVLGMGWFRILDFEVDRLDDRLCMEARRIANPGTMSGRDNDLLDLSADIGLKLRLERSSQLMLQANDGRGQLRLRTPGADLELLARSLDWQAKAQASSASGRADPRGACRLSTLEFMDADWRVAHVQADQGQAWLAADLHVTRSELQSAMRQALTSVMPLALVSTGLAAWLMASLMMRPVNRLRESMRAVSHKALDRRLPTAGEDREFRELITAYNTMLDRLEASFHQASRFSADAAHELRTPLTILQGRIEQAVKRAGHREVQAELGEILDEVGRLSGITRKLLLLSQADAGKLILTPETIDISQLLENLLADARMIAGDQRVHGTIPPGLRLQGDMTLLRQLFNNLISNALRYTRPQGRIELSAAASGEGIEVLFANDCEPLDQAQRARFFERFYRADAAHGRRTDGTGLGLSLAREIARSHGGDLILLPSPAGRVLMRLWLPY